MSGYSSVRTQQGMFFDQMRNKHYLSAIQAVVDKDSVVMDLGSGLGIHGYMAAEAGAKKVYMVEPALVLETTRQVIAENKLTDRIVCLRGTIEEIDLPEKVDVIISVFTGNFLLEEDLLPSLFYARDKYLKPGGKLIPDRAMMQVVPVYLPEYYKENIDCWSSKRHGVNFESIKTFACNSLHYERQENWGADFLSEPANLLEMDFMTANEASCRAKTEVKVTKNSLCHGWLGWFNMRLGDTWLSTSPLSEQLHWRQVFLPLADPVSVEAGDLLSFELNRPEYGDWSWKSTHNTISQQQSTFLSTPVTPGSFLKKMDSYQPQISPKGKAMLDTLSMLNGEQSTAQIIDAIHSMNTSLFPTRKNTAHFVKQVIGKYTR